MDWKPALIRWAEIQSGALTPVKKRSRAALKQPASRAPTKAKPGRRRNFDAAVWGFAPPWAKALYVAAERRSAASGRAVFLSPEEFLFVVRRADGACELSGLPFDVSRDKPKARRAFAPSLDRIDCGKGYVPGNVRIVSTIINCALGDFGESALRIAAEAFLRHSAGVQLPQAGASTRE